jgi:hypothetical protein
MKMKMMMIEFYEKPTAGKERAGYYDGFEIERPIWVWHIYRDLEKQGVRFHIVMMGDEAIHVEARTYHPEKFYYKEYIRQDDNLGASIDQFIRNSKDSFEKFGTTVVEEPINENNLSQGEQLSQLQDDQLDAPTDGLISDRRVESGNGPSEHGGEDDSSGLDSLGNVRVSS